MSGSKKYVRACLYYLGLALFICILLKYAFNLPVRNFIRSYSVPLTYTGDAYGALLTAQNYISGGSTRAIVNLGAPFGWYNNSTIFCSLYNFYVYLGSLFTDHAALIINGIYLLSYPVTGIITAFTLRKLNINPYLSFLGGVLYAFLPYHYMRNIWHLWLALYYMVPFVCLISIWILKGETVSQPKINGTGSYIRQFLNKKMLFSVIVCLIVPYGDVYGAYFSIIIIFISSVFFAIKNKKTISLVQGLLLDMVIALGLVVQMLPSIISSGSAFDPLTSARLFSDSEWYGLKIVQMLLPVSGHRLDFLSSIADNYNTHAPLVTENRTATLGFFMSAGFIISIFISAFVRNNDRYSLESDLGTMNIIVVLLATIGGFGVLIALFATSVIRCYNRLSIFIAFYSLAVLLLFIPKIFSNMMNKVKLVRTLQAKRSYKIVTAAIMAILTVFFSFVGVYDQVGATAKQVFPTEEWNNDEKFIKEIESALPASSMVFELPAIGTEGGIFIGKFLTYDIWKPVLHSTTLKWSASYGIWDESDCWDRFIGSLPADEMLKNISAMGFNGLYIDSYGYSPEDFSKLQNEMENNLHAKPVVSDNKRLYFYDIRKYKEETISRSASPVYGRSYSANENEPGVEYFSGWYEKEDWGRWSAGKKSNILFALPQTDEAKGKDVVVSMDANILSQPGGLDVSAYCQNELLLKQKLTESGKISFTIPERLIQNKGFADITLQIDNPISPAALGLSADGRELGLGIKSVYVDLQK